jgi:oligopeptidase A
VITEHLIWLKRMTLEKATLPVPQFDQITLVQLQQQIEQAIQQGQSFLKDLSEVPESIQGQLAVLEQVDHLENNMSEAWGVLSHLNAVMNNAETREVYQSLFPDAGLRFLPSPRCYQTQHVQTDQMHVWYRHDTVLRVKDGFPRRS